MGSVHTARFPRQAPVQPVSFQPFAAAALNVSRWNASTVAAHRPGQAIPALGPRTVPLPETLTASLNVRAPKSAVTEPA
jgi:hypothetical protein